MDQATLKEVVVVSRHWDNPNITVRIDKDQIQVEMTLEAFCKAMVAEVPHPFLTLTRAQLEKQCLGVIQTVLNKAKEATAQI